MDTYHVSGVRSKPGGEDENFQVEQEFASSREAYVTVTDGSYNSGYTTVRVVAIKMKCTNCGDCHVTVPPDLYL